MLQSRSTANPDGPSGPANPGKNTAVPRTLTDERRSIDRRMRGAGGVATTSRGRSRGADTLRGRPRASRGSHTRSCPVASRRNRARRTPSMRAKLVNQTKADARRWGPRGAGPTRSEWIRSRRAIRTSVAPSPWQNLEIARAMGTYRRRSSACLRGLGCAEVRADIRVELTK